MAKLSAKFSNREKAFADELSKYEDKWVAISRKGDFERVIASGDTVIDAKREADKRHAKNVVYRKVSSSKKILATSPMFR